MLTLKTKARRANGIRLPGSLSRKRWILGIVRIDQYSVVANTLSIPPGEYIHKNETQRQARSTVRYSTLISLPKV